MPVLGERFYQMSNTIFCYDLKPIPLAVYSYLVCCAEQKDVCWPSMKTIALHCGCSENAARDAVGLLADRGFISKVKTSRCVKSGKWLQGNNHYYILPLPMLSGIIADSFQFSEEDLRRRRAESVRNVKQTNGRISFEKRVRESVKDDDGWQG